MSEQYDSLAERLAKATATMRAAAGDEIDPVGLATMNIRHGLFKKSTHSILFHVNGNELLLVEVDADTLAAIGELRRPVRESVTRVNVKPIKSEPKGRPDLHYYGSDISFTDGAGLRTSLAVVEGRSGLFEGEDASARDQLDRAHSDIAAWFA